VKQIWTGTLIGLALALAAGALLVPYCGARRQEMGHHAGEKEGMIQVIDFHARCFPKPDGRPIDSDRHEVVHGKRD